MSLIGHGILLLIALVLAGLPYFWVEQVYPSLTTTIVATIIYAFVDGFIAKNMADIWEEEREEDTDSEWRTPQTR
jgi:Na+/melibiose symporter-like transporter